MADCLVRLCYQFTLCGLYLLACAFSGAHMYGEKTLVNLRDISGTTVELL